MQAIGAWAKIALMHQLAPTQGRISSGRAWAALFTHSGSAISARASATMSQSPPAMNASASAGSTMRPTPTTGRLTASLIRRVAGIW